MSWSMALSDIKDETKYYHLFVAGAWTQMMIACIGSYLWVSTILRHRDMMLTKMKVSITCEAKMGLMAALVFCLTELLPMELVSKAVDSSSKLCMMIWFDPVVQEARTPSGRKGTTLKVFSMTFSKSGRGKKFWVLLAFFPAAGGRHTSDTGTLGEPKVWMIGQGMTFTQAIEYLSTISHLCLWSH